MLTKQGRHDKLLLVAKTTSNKTLKKLLTQTTFDDKIIKSLRTEQTT
ncbi:UNVERIFIED_CONTAM: hypothetical protein N8J90_18925 [Halobacillus marinus]